MSAILAIDPGCTDSAYTLINPDTCQVLELGKEPNADVAAMLRTEFMAGRVAKVAVEMIASYGMPVGAEVFETCTWIGRYQQICDDHQVPVELVFRRIVKAHLCEDSRAKDANVIQALIDRFAAGERNRGKGTKSEPGFFFGFHSDIWQAMAIAVTVADKDAGR